MAKKDSIKKKRADGKRAVRFINQDSWANIFTGIGNKATSKQENTEFILRHVLTERELSDIYRGEGFGKKIVDVPAADMVREWFKIEGDTDNTVVKYLDQAKLATPKFVKEAQQWARLFGGSIIVMGINDGSRGERALEKPLREDRIKSIEFYQVYDRHQINWNTQDLDPNPNSANFNQPLLYTITPSVEVPTTQFKVHHTRVLRFMGEPLPKRVASENRFWGDSVLQAVFIRLRGFGETLIATEAIIQEFLVGILTIKNLGDLVGSKNGPKLIQNRLQQLDMSKHMLNTMLVDVDEDYKRIAADVNGIKDILDFLKDALSGVGGLPQIKLFGEQTKGLGSQASGNIRLYYDDVKEMQKDKLKPQLERLVSLVLLAKDYQKRFKSSAIKGEEWELKFNPLWQMTDKEVAEMRKLNAQSDDLYLEEGVLTQEEVAESRFGGDAYSGDTKLSKEGRAKRKKGLVPVAGRRLVGKGEGDTDPPKGDPDDGNNAKSGSSGST